jgi:hypothetical protein
MSKAIFLGRDSTGRPEYIQKLGEEMDKDIEVSTVSWSGPNA